MRAVVPGRISQEGRDSEEFAPPLLLRPYAANLARRLGTIASILGASHCAKCSRAIRYRSARPRLYCSVRCKRKAENARHKQHRTAYTRAWRARRKARCND